MLDHHFNGMEKGVFNIYKLIVSNRLHISRFKWDFLHRFTAFVSLNV